MQIHNDKAFLLEIEVPDSTTIRQMREVKTAIDAMVNEEGTEPWDWDDFVDSVEVTADLLVITTGEREFDEKIPMREIGPKIREIIPGAKVTMHTHITQAHSVTEHP